MTISVGESIDRLFRRYGPFVLTASAETTARRGPRATKTFNPFGEAKPRPAPAPKPQKVKPTPTPAEIEARRQARRAREGAQRRAKAAPKPPRIKTVLEVEPRYCILDGCGALIPRKSRECPSDYRSRNYCCRSHVSSGARVKQLADRPPLAEDVRRERANESRRRGKEARRGVQHSSGETKPCLLPDCDQGGAIFRMARDAPSDFAKRKFCCNRCVMRHASRARGE